MSVLSVVILTKNEEANIGACIETVAFADEVLVIDDFSTDGTVALAEAAGARVLQRELEGDWASQRMFGAERATGDMILFLDADERISERLAEEIRSVLAAGEHKAYRFRRHNLFHYNRATRGVLRSDAVLRLLPKDGLRVEGYVHEAILSPYEAADLSGPLYHYTYDNWHQYFNKFNSYTTAAAYKMRDAGKRCDFVRDILFRPAWGFFKMYVVHRGFLDGRMGFQFSVFHAFYTMVKYVKLHTLLKSGGKL